MAAQIARIAASVTAASDADPLVALAALRPLPALLQGEPPDLTTSPETLRLCADLIDLLQALSDRSAAHQVATDCLALAERYNVSGVAVDRLAAAAIALRLWSCDSDGHIEAGGEDADALAARVSDPEPTRPSWWSWPRR